MYCRNCGNEILDDAVVCPKCGCQVKPITNQSSSNAKVTVAKIFIILSCIFGFFLFFIPTIVGIIAYNKLSHAKTKNELTGIAICTLIFCNTIAGIIMLTINDEDLN